MTNKRRVHEGKVQVLMFRKAYNINTRSWYTFPVWVDIEDERVNDK